MESMRLCPPVGGLARQATHGMKSGGYEVPEGTTVFVRTSIVYKELSTCWPVISVGHCPHVIYPGPQHCNQPVHVCYISFTYFCILLYRWAIMSWGVCQKTSKTHWRLTQVALILTGRGEQCMLLYRVYAPFKRVYYTCMHSTYH